jgi:hypothetical protein
MQQGINEGPKFGNFFGEDEEHIIINDLTSARLELVAAQNLLTEAAMRLAPQSET